MVLFVQWIQFYAILMYEWYDCLNGALRCVTRGKCQNTLPTTSNRSGHPSAFRQLTRYGTTMICNAMDASIYSTGIVLSYC